MRFTCHFLCIFCSKLFVPSLFKTSSRLGNFSRVDAAGYIRVAGRNAFRSSCNVCLFFSVNQNWNMSIDFSKLSAGLYFHGFTWRLFRLCRVCVVTPRSTTILYPVTRNSGSAVLELYCEEGG